MRIILIIVPLVSSDICQDFCTQQLGSGDCSRGSYCKNNFDCHGLFWTSAEQSAICVYTGPDGSCPNRFPVLCHEAASRLLERSAHVTSSPERTSRPPVTAIVAPTTFSQRSVAPSVTSTTLPPITRSPPSEDNWFRLFNHYARNVGLTTQTSTSTNTIDHRARDNVTTVKVYVPGYSHLYVRLSFLNEGRDLGYYALFDSGSYMSYTFIEILENSFNRSHMPWEPREWIRDEREQIIRAAQDGEAYRQIPSIVPVNPRILEYGVHNATRRFPSIGTIPENIRIFSGPSSFTFHEPRLYLVPPPGDRTRVLLGASRSSSFAAAAGAFAVIPSHLVDQDSSSDWQLLIGQNSTIHAQIYCRHDEELSPSIQWYNTTNTVHFFAVEGYMWLQNPGSSSLPSVQRLEMVIDTGGTDQFWLSPVMMDAVVAEIESHGPRRIPSDTGFPLFENCTPSNIPLTNGLALRFMPSERSDTPYDNALSLAFPIRGSISFITDLQQCTLTWKIGTVGASPNRLVIGTKILSKFVTVFDHTNQRVGFCRRSQTPIQ